MAKFKVSELTRVSTINPQDLLYLVQTGASRSIYVSDLLKTIATSGNSSVTIAQTNGNVTVKSSNVNWVFNENGTLSLPILTSAPANVTAGSIAIADGAGWNPANTGAQTVVCYINGSWAKLN